MSRDPVALGDTSKVAQGTRLEASGSRASAGEFFAFVLAAAVLVMLALGRFDEPAYPSADALRYIDYAVNMHEHGIFGLIPADGRQRPSPGNANMPLYPAWLAFAMGANADVEASLRCIAAEVPTTPGCVLKLEPLWLMQGALLVPTLMVGWAAARHVFGTSLPGWVAAGVVVASGDLVYYANRVLTEALVVPFFALGMLGLAAAWSTGRSRHIALAGMWFGLAALTRPGTEYFVGCFFVALLLASLVTRRAAVAKHALVVGFAFAAVLAPWSARNYVHFSSGQLSSGYGGYNFAYRVAYNRMSWAEWGTSFVYWLPDFGDSLAKKLFAPQHYVKLSFGPKSYYAEEAPKIYQESLARTGSPDAVLGDLLRREVFAHPVKHALVSVPLALRGIFPGRFWGLLGFVCTVGVLFVTLRRRDYAFAGLALPACFMAVFYAGVTVSISRYNINLIPVYGLAIGWCAVTGWLSWCGFVRRRRA